MSATRVTTIRLPEDLADQLDMVARVDGLTQSEVIRAAVEQHLERRQSEQSFRARLADRIAHDQSILEGLS